MEELRALIRTYSQATQRDYEQNQAGYDATALAQMIQTTTVTSEEDNDQLSSTCTKFFGENFQMCLEYPRPEQAHHWLPPNLRPLLQHHHKVWEAGDTGGKGPGKGGDRTGDQMITIL